jgi:hypothetical protein
MNKVETIVKMVIPPENMHPPTRQKQSKNQTVPQYPTLFFSLSKKQKNGGMIRTAPCHHSAA